MDEIVRPMQGTSTEAAFVGFDPLPVRMGMGGSSGGSWEPDRIQRINKEICLRVNAVTPSSSKSEQF